MTSTRCVRSFVARVSRPRRFTKSVGAASRRSHCRAAPHSACTSHSTLWRSNRHPDQVVILRSPSSLALLKDRLRDEGPSVLVCGAPRALTDFDRRGVNGFWGLVGFKGCLLYTSDAADERSSVDLGGRRI